MSPTTNSLKAVLLILTFTCATPTAEAGVPLPGKAIANGGSTPVTWNYDTGADVSTASHATAAAIGLDPSNADGSWSSSSGYEFWCYENVWISCKDSDGDSCLGITTVYVSKSDDVWALNDNLGKEIRQKFRGQFDEVTRKVNWQTQYPDPLMFVSAWSELDSQSNATKFVQDVVLGHAGGTATAPMAYASGAEYSFVRCSVADALGARTIATINLVNLSPSTYTSLIDGWQVVSGQVFFDVVQIDTLDLGVGPVQHDVILLVSEDANSDFGVIGNDLLTGGGPGGFHWFETDAMLESILFLRGPVPVTPPAAAGQ